MSRHGGSEEFFRAFCGRVVSEQGLLNDAEVELALARVLDNDVLSDILFQAYRHVSLARSSKLGPRIIGLLTAKLVAEERQAKEHEETIFAVAEALNDGHLRSYRAFLQEYRAEAQGKDVREEKDGLTICLAKEQFDSNWRKGEATSTGAIDLGQHFGSWTRPLQNFGVLVHDTKELEFDYDEDSERHIDEPGTAREITWWLFVQREYFELGDLIERADWDQETG